MIKCCCCFPLQLISSVWSPQSIEFSLQQFCLPFLRLSCLLQHHLYGDNLTGCLVCFIISVFLPAETTGVCESKAGDLTALSLFVSSQEEEEFSSLAVCLGLLPSAPQPSNVVHSASCLQWPVGAFDLVTQWCVEVTGLSQMQAEQSLVGRFFLHLLFHYFFRE